MGFGLARIFNGLHWFFDPAFPGQTTKNDGLPHRASKPQPNQRRTTGIPLFAAKPRCATTRRYEAAKVLQLCVRCL